MHGDAPLLGPPGNSLLHKMPARIQSDAGRLAWPLDRRVEAVLVAVLIGAIFLARSLSSAMLVGAMNDDGVYTALGKAIAEGHGYVSIHLVGAPVQEKYPPGFPLILSIFWRLTRSVEGVQQLVGIVHPVVVAATAGLLWWVGRVRNAPRSVLVLLVLMPLLFDSAIQYYTIPLSEPWLMLGWAAVLALWEILDDASPGRRLLWLSATAIVAVFTILVRSQGIVLVPAIVLALFVRRFSLRERVTTISLMVVPLVAWHFYHASLLARGPLSDLPDEAGYAAWATGGQGVTRYLLDSTMANVASYVNQIGSLLSGVAAVGIPLSALLIGAMAIGSIGLVRRQPLLGVSALCALGIVALWPYAQDRLLLSVMPFGGLAFAVWISQVASRWSARTSRGVAYSVVVAIALVFIRQADIRQDSVEAFSASRAPTSSSPTYSLLVNSRFIANVSAWIRINSPPSSHVMVDNHSGVYLYTDRTTSPASPAESSIRLSVFAHPGQYLATRIMRDSLDYVIIAALAYPAVGMQPPGMLRDVRAVRSRCPGVLNPLEGNEAILKVHRDDGCLTILAEGNQDQELLRMR